MLGILAIIAIATMIAMTFVIYRSFGPKTGRLLYSIDEKKRFDSLLEENFGIWFARTSIFATLTSLATVYVFFIGNVQLLGFWIFASPITLIIGSFITVKITKSILNNYDFKKRFDSKDQSSSIISSLFWDGTNSGRHVAKIVNYIFIGYLLIVLWLEFSVFAKITGRLIAPESIDVELLVLFLTFFFISYFTLRYGVRGFVYADLFQSPIIIAGTLIVLTGAIFYAGSESSNNIALVSSQLLATVSSPSLPISNGIVFCISVLFLNTFMVVTTPAHWVRVWIFGPKRLMGTQINSTVVTAFIWVLLIIVGGAAATLLRIDGNNLVGGEEAVIGLLKGLASYSYVLVFVFWIVGVATLFSTADSQLFSLMLLLNYSPKDNSLKDRMKLKYPGICAFTITLIFSALYFLIHLCNIPLDKLVLSVLPACLTIVPALISLMYHKPVSPIIMIVSISLYMITIIIGLLTDQGDYLFTLGAPITSLLMAAYVWVGHEFKNKKINILKGGSKA